MNDTVDPGAQPQTKCPACDQPTYQNRQLVGLGGRPEDRQLVVVDPTWRHTREGTVAVDVIGTTVCTRSAATPVGLTNQGQPVQGDQVPYAKARAQLLRQTRDHAVNCTVCLTPTWNANARCDDHQEEGVTDVAFVQACAAIVARAGNSANAEKRQAS